MSLLAPPRQPARRDPLLPDAGPEATRPRWVGPALILLLAGTAVLYLWDLDKPPASLWVIEISARLFGLNSWSILVPQALEGVAAVGVLYATVRRWFRPGAALLAGRSRR